MSLSSVIAQSCPQCGHSVEVTIERSLRLDDESSRHRVLENRFNWLECGECGEKRPLEVDVLVCDPERGVTLQVVARDDEVPSASTAMSEFLGPHPEFARIVSSREELVEKLRLHAHGLDDAAVEIVKLLLRTQLGDQAGRTRRHYERTDGLRSDSNRRPRHCCSARSAHAF